MRISCTAGDALSITEIERYLFFLETGGAVKYLKTAKERLRSALVVVTMEHQQHLVAMGAIKAPCPSYNEKISQRSGWPLNPHKREIGYIAVEPKSRGRGYSTEIVRRLLDFDDRVFATTSNPAMMQVFRNFNFKQEGHEWESKEGDTLSLWIKWQ